jgi:hypothetical protein
MAKKGQEDKQWSTNVQTWNKTLVSTQKTKDWTTWNSWKTGGELIVIMNPIDIFKLFFTIPRKKL